MITSATVKVKTLILEQQDYAMIYELLRSLHSIREDVNQDKDDDIEDYISMFEKVVESDIKYIHLVEEQTVRRLCNFLKELINLYEKDYNIESVLKTSITFNEEIYTGESKMFTSLLGTTVEINTCHIQIAEDILNTLVEAFFLGFDCDSRPIYALETTLVQI